MKRLVMLLICTTLLGLGVWFSDGFAAGGQTWDTTRSEQDIPNTSTPGSIDLWASARTFAPAADTFIAADTPDQNYGANTALTVRRLGNEENDAIILIRFDLSSMPPQTDVQSAQLSLILTDDDGELFPIIDAYAVTQPWQEMTVTWQTQPTLANESVSAATVEKTPSRAFSWDVTPLVAEWLAHPQTNYGLALRVRGQDLEALRVFGSRESDDIPRLTLAYTLPALERPTPTPTPFPEHLEATLPLSQTAYLRWEGDRHRDTVWPNRGTLPLSHDTAGLLQERCLLQFDLSALPEDAVIYEARLYLHLEGGTNETPVSIRAHMMRLPWRAETAAWANAAWAANEEADAPRGWVSVPLNAPGWVSMDVTRAVQRWISGRSANYGFMLVGPDGTDTPWSRIFSGISEPDFAPYLHVRYARRAEAPRAHAGSALPAPVRHDLCPYGAFQLFAPDMLINGVLTPQRREWGRILTSTVISGTVSPRGGDISHEELPSTHIDHDFLFHIWKDANNAWAMGGANGGDMEIEWEHQVWPRWAWPTGGNKAIVFGPLVYDCGHDVEKGGKTEIHPPRGVVTIREKVAADTLGHGGTGTLLVTRADIYFSSRRTPASCGGWCAPPPLRPLYVPLGDRDYEFDI